MEEILKMFIDGNLMTELFNNPFILFAFKIGFTITAILYFIFTLIVIGQVRMMTETVNTEAGSLLRFFSIIHAGIALGLIVLFIAFF